MKKSPVIWKAGPIGYGAIIEGLSCGIQRLGGASRPWRFRGFVAHVAIPGFCGLRLTLGEAKRDVEAHARQMVRERNERIQVLRDRASRPKLPAKGN